MRIGHEPWAEELADGESVAVDGVCLTVASRTADSFACDVLGETLARTTIGRKKKGDRVNLERALRVGDRMGGHMVSGHVDGTGTVAARAARGREVALSIRCDAALARRLVEKGSVACNGVSLTVAELRPDGFTVHLVPTTLAATSLSGLGPGEVVNVELDMLGKFVRRHLATDRAAVTEQTLRDAGF